MAWTLPEKSFVPVRQDIVEKYGTDYAATADKNVYCGPFVLSSTDNMTYVFEKNPTYWDADSIKLDRCELSVVTDDNTALAMYESGDLDYVKIPTSMSRATIRFSRTRTSVLP